MCLYKDQIHSDSFRFIPNLEPAMRSVDVERSFLEATEHLTSSKLLLTLLYKLFSESHQFKLKGFRRCSWCCDFRHHYSVRLASQF